MGFSVVVTGVLVAACGSSPQAAPPSTSSPSGSTVPAPPTSAVTPAGDPPAVPSGHAYLGAWVHPVAPGSGGSAFAVEQDDLPSLEAATGRPLAILHIYAPWSQPAPVADLTAVVAGGSIPLLDWGCGPSGPAVASGADDQQITAYAQALKAWGKPVFLRWCWEMNLVAAHSQLGGPAVFVAAWTHIWNLFQQEGATNVSFVWCPALSGVDPAPYYPGDRYVNWIGIDGYDRSGSSTFTSLFSGFYQQWAGHGLPMMVAETGSTGSNQAAYIASIGTGMPALPGFKAIVYFDATGPAADWQLVGAGLTAFGQLAQDPYFNPT